jgi:hypothetical protein
VSHRHEFPPRDLSKAIPTPSRERVLRNLDATDLGLLSRVSRDCRDAVVSSGLPRAGASAALPFKVEHFVESVELLDFARVNGCQVLDERTFALAAGNRTGSLVIKHLAELGCPWCQDMFHKAVMKGNLEVLRFLRETLGYTWDAYESTKAFTLTALAARGGHIEVIQYLREQGVGWGKWTCVNAASGGHVDTLIWLRASGCPWETDPGFELNGGVAMSAGWAAENGHTDVLTWLQANGNGWDSWTPAYAAKGGQLETLKWLLARGCPYDEWVCAYAAHNSNIEVLEYARDEVGIECGELTKTFICGLHMGLYASRAQPHIAKE